MIQEIGHQLIDHPTQLDVRSNRKIEIAGRSDVVRFRFFVDVVSQQPIEVGWIDRDSDAEIGISRLKKSSVMNDCRDDGHDCYWMDLVTPNLM